MYQEWMDKFEELKKENEKNNFTRIVCSAIKCNNKIYIGARHHIILQAYRYIEPNIKLGEQGFIDNFGKFYNRKEAKKLVLEKEQIKETKHKELFSEDLW